MDPGSAVAEMEITAYTAVLKVLSLDELSWAKDDLLGKLRKELNVTVEEHEAVKNNIMQDQDLNDLRDELQYASQPGKKSRTGPSTYGEPAPRSGAFSGRGPPAAASQPLSKRIPPGKAKKTGKEKSAPVTPGVPRSSSLSGAVLSQHISKRVKRNWPEYGGWLDAVITDYDPNTDEHVITYDLGTSSESWEKVNLAEMQKDEFKFGNGTISVSEMSALPPTSSAAKPSAKRPAPAPAAKSRAHKKSGSSSSRQAGGEQFKDAVKGLEVEVDKAGSANKLAEIKQNLVSNEQDLLAQLNELEDSDEDSD